MTDRLCRSDFGMDRRIGVGEREQGAAGRKGPGGPAAGEQIDILGVKVDRVDMSAAIKRFSEMMETPGCSQIVTPNSEIVVNAVKDPVLATLIRQADLVIPDGIGLVYASKILGQPLGERVTGIDFADAALAWLAERGGSVYFLGSKPDAGMGDGRSVARIAAEKKKEQYSGLRIAGARDGYFKEQDEEEIVEEINRSGADFLCVALGSPKQELFVSRYKERLSVKAAVGIGGTLDVWAGTLQRAPEFYRKHGLEWLYRFIQEPARYKRMAALPLFMIKVIASKGRKKDGN